MVAKYAGRAGDGFICTSGKGMELYTDKLLPAVDEGAQAAGRDAAQIDRTIEIKMSYDRDHERALENCRFWAPLSLTAGAEAQRGLARRRWSGWPTSCRSSRSRSGGSSPRTPTRPSPRSSPTSTPGSTTWSFHGPGHDQERFLTQFADDVLPALRALG